MTKMTPRENKWLEEYRRLLIMILVNVFNSIKELIRNKRIAAEKNAAETSEDAPVAK